MMNAMNDKGIVVKQFEGVNFTPDMIAAVKSLVSNGTKSAGSLINILDQVHVFIQDADFLDEDPEEVLGALRIISRVRRELKPLRDGMSFQPGEAIFGEDMVVECYSEPCRTTALVEEPEPIYQPNQENDDKTD